MQHDRQEMWNQAEGHLGHSLSLYILSSFPLINRKQYLAQDSTYMPKGLNNILKKKSSASEVHLASYTHLLNVNTY